MPLLRYRGLIVLCALALPVPGVFGQQSDAPKKTAPQISKASAIQSKVGSKESSCDGALEIVPSQPMSFVRKRRPTRTSPASPETKAQKNKAGESQN